KYVTPEPASSNRNGWPSACPFAASRIRCATNGYSHRRLHRRNVSFAQSLPYLSMAAEFCSRNVRLNSTWRLYSSLARCASSSDRRGIPVRKCIATEDARHLSHLVEFHLCGLGEGRAGELIDHFLVA